MDKLQKIRIRINDVDLPMQVKSADEEKRYRDAAAYVNSRLLSVKQRYPNVPDPSYYTAIVMLDLARKGVEVSNAHSVEPYQRSLAELDHEIVSALSKQ